MARRRAGAAGSSGKLSRHTSRAAGITAYLDNTGTIKNAQLKDIVWDAVKRDVPALKPGLRRLLQDLEAQER